MNYREIIIHIRKIVRALNLESKRIQKEFGISIPQLLCMQYLAECNDFRATHKDVAEFLKLNSSTVTGIISRLEKKNFVARLPKSGDKRITFVSLTSMGFKLLEKSPDLMHQTLAKKLPELPEKTLLELDSSLKVLIDCLDINNTDASPLFIIDDPITL
ncbi:MAG: MarR family transcriptional regulator [Bacteroidales bacterium]|nr:MarR family transcriptional regulator [Bacteroidales bacterium]